MYRSIITALPVLLASCSSPAPQTRDYFTKVTRLQLCEVATVRNVPADLTSRARGNAVYVADVNMPDTDDCNMKLFGSFIERTRGAPCAPTRGCTGRSAKGEIYRLDPVGAGWRITYSR